MQVNGGTDVTVDVRVDPDILGSDGIAATLLLGEGGTVGEVGGRVPATHGCRQAPPPSMAQTILEQPVWSPSTRRAPQSRHGTRACLRVERATTPYSGHAVREL